MECAIDSEESATKFVAGKYDEDLARAAWKRRLQIGAARWVKRAFEDPQRSFKMISDFHVFPARVDYFRGRANSIGCFVSDLTLMMRSHALTIAGRRPSTTRIAGRSSRELSAMCTQTMTGTANRIPSWTAVRKALRTTIWISSQ